MIGLALLLVTALASPPAGEPGRYSLADCGFRKIDLENRGVAGPTRPLALLFRTSGEDGALISAADLRLFDPSGLLMDLPLMGGFYTRDRKMLFILTDDARPVHFKLVLAPQKRKRTWGGGLGMSGAGSAEEHLAHSYMGECTIDQPADAVARFEALGAAR